MKTFLTIFVITIIFNIYTFAQREIKPGGKGQESGRIERIKRNQDNTRIIDKHPGTIERPPKKTVERHQERRPRRESGVPIEGEAWNFCTEIKPAGITLVDIVYILPPPKLAIQCFENEDYYGAILYLNEAIEDDPFDAKLYFLRGKSYLEINDYIKAIRDFTTVNVLDPLFPDAYYYRGMSNLYLGEMKLAKEDFKIAASLGDTLAESFLVRYSN